LGRGAKIQSRDTFPLAIPQPLTVDELLQRTALPILQVVGNRQLCIATVAPPEAAIENSLAFYERRGAKALDAVLGFRAGVLLVGIEVPPVSGRCFIQVADPRAWFIAAVDRLFPTRADAEIDSSAVISTSATVGDGVSIGAHSRIEDDVSIGAETRIGQSVIIHAGTQIGERCRIQDNTTIGGVGLAFYHGVDGQSHFFPHLGRVLIGADVWIGANSCIVRGMLNDTVIGTRSKLGNLVNIGHNCTVGNDCFISSGVLLCGRVTLEDGVRMAAQACISDHVRVGAGAWIGLGSVVTKAVAPKARVFGTPAAPLPTMRPF
jgi:UDP-3-O-[3-hydroxymyristoyl] glucosamine N-acyltransferase